jgi:hypothetical protein
MQACTVGYVLTNVTTEKSSQSLERWYAWPTPSFSLFIPSFIKIGWGIQKLVGGTYRHIDWREGFMKYAFEMCSDAIIFIPSFIKIGSGVQKLIRGDTQTAWWSHKPTLFFQNKERRLKILCSIVCLILSCVPVTEIFCGTDYVLQK